MYAEKAPAALLPKMLWPLLSGISFEICSCGKFTKEAVEMTLSLMNIIVLFVLAVPMGYMVHISRRKKKKWIASAAIILYILVWVALKSYPLEASFATFQTPEQAAGYYNPNTEGVKYVLEGEETCLVILSKGKEDETINCLLRKTEDGYRYMSLARLKPISTQNGFVHWVKETADYYLFAKTF